MFDTILNFEFNSLLGILLYWVPLSLCLYGYTLRTWVNYQHDVKERALHEEQPKGNFYSPTDTIGTLIGRGIVTIVPVANLWAAAFDVAPKMFRSFFEWIGKVFDMPLVPEKKEK